MSPNPLLGVVLHWLGGLSSRASIAVQERAALVLGDFLAHRWRVLLDHRAVAVRELAHARSLARPRLDIGIDLVLVLVLGRDVGIGGLTFGLVMRYLGLSLGMAVALGLTTVIGTLGPPIFHGTIGAIASATSGQITLVGVVITLTGMAIVANAGGARSVRSARRRSARASRIQSAQGTRDRGVSG